MWHSQNSFQLRIYLSSRWFHPFPRILKRFSRELMPLSCCIVNICKFPSLHHYDKLDKLQKSYKVEVFKFPFRAWKITSAPARKKELWALRLISPAAASRFSKMMEIKIHQKISSQCVIWTRLWNLNFGNFLFEYAGAVRGLSFSRRKPSLWTHFLTFVG